ncbi:MAG: hypothetical protein ACRDJ4_08360 [Actinomycetota bacterium]
MAGVAATPARELVPAVPVQGVFTLVGLELLIGTFVLMWVTLLVWRVVDRGHYRAATWVLFPLQAALSFALGRDLRTAGLITAGAMAVFLAAAYSQRPLVEWITGGLASAAGLWVVAQLGVDGCGCAAGAPQAFAGALFLGAVSHGMTLGHWYLNQPRLPIEPLRGAGFILLGSIAVSLVAGLVSRPELIRARIGGGLLAFSGAGYWWAWLLLLAGTAILAVMVRATVATRATQSATGLLYIAMVTAIAAQFLMTLLLAA